MEASVATLLLVASAVILTCIVVNYAVAVFEQTLNLQNLPEMDRIRDLQRSLLNQTEDFFNQTQSGSSSLSQP
jgi:hypothetical protein